MVAAFPFGVVVAPTVGIEKIERGTIAAGR